MGKLFRGFGSISKIDDNADGTITVYGVASTGCRDSAGEIVDPEAMRAALPKFQRFPSLREMHQPVAAGRVTEAYVDDAGATQIAALVVDPVAISKVKNQVYAAFSIGGTVTKRDPDDRTIIRGINLIEISLVDVPACPEAALTMWKADMTEYTPSGDEVVAKAREIAEAAGSKRYKDFLFKARETLIADALAGLGDEDEDLTKTDEVESADATTAPPEAAPEGAEVTTDETDEAKLAAAAIDAADEPVDPAAALAAAIVKANDAVTVPVVAAEPTPFDDMAKAGAALALIAKTVQTDDVTKGLWFIPGSARVLECFGDLASSIAWEQRSEGDDSQVPAMAVEILNQLRDFVIAVTTEEVSELLTQITTNLPDLTLTMIDGESEIVMLANGIVDLVKADTDLMEKVGARNSKRDAAMIQQSHDHMTKLGATCDKDNCAKVEGVEDDETIKAALVADNERLAKALTDAAPAIVELTAKFETTIAGLTKRLEQVESEPAAPKTASGPLRAITKAEDASPGASGTGSQISAEELQKVIDSLPEAERGQLLLRVALNQPQPVQTARAAA